MLDPGSNSRASRSSHAGGGGDGSCWCCCQLWLCWCNLFSSSSVSSPGCCSGACGVRGLGSGGTKPLRHKPVLLLSAAVCVKQRGGSVNTAPPSLLPPAAASETMPTPTPTPTPLQTTHARELHPAQVAFSIDRAHVWNCERRQIREKKRGDKAGPSVAARPLFMRRGRCPPVCVCLRAGSLRYALVAWAAGLSAIVAVSRKARAVNVIVNAKAFLAVLSLLCSSRRYPCPALPSHASPPPSSSPPPHNPSSVVDDLSVSLLSFSGGPFLLLVCLLSPV